MSHYQTRLYLHLGFKHQILKMCFQREGKEMGNHCNRIYLPWEKELAQKAPLGRIAWVLKY